MSTLATALERTASEREITLTELGKRLEMLRLERGISKLSLARSTGASRQQLWRVMTGRSALTRSLAGQLGVVLGVHADDLLAIPAGRPLTVSFVRRRRGPPASPTANGSDPSSAVLASPDPTAVSVAGFWPVWEADGPADSRSGRKKARKTGRRGVKTFAEFLADPEALRRALKGLPDDGPGSRVRRDLIAALCREAIEADLPLPDGLGGTR